MKVQHVIAYAVVGVVLPYVALAAIADKQPAPVVRNAPPSASDTWKPPAPMDPALLKRIEDAAVAGKKPCTCAGPAR